MSRSRDVKAKLKLHPKIIKWVANLNLIVSANKYPSFATDSVRNELDCLGTQWC
jgi:hypothetical protein